MGQYLEIFLAKIKKLTIHRPLTKHTVGLQRGLGYSQAITNPSSALRRAWAAPDSGPQPTAHSLLQSSGVGVEVTDAAAKASNQTPADVSGSVATAQHRNLALMGAPHECGGASQGCRLRPRGCSEQQGLEEWGPRPAWGSGPNAGSQSLRLTSHSSVTVVESPNLSEPAQV